MLSEIETDVLIVGAGPTGLMAANQLMRFGIDFVIIDKKEGPTRESRAILVTARSLELYQQMGIHDHAVKNGKQVQSFYLYFKGKKKAEVKIGEIGKGLSEFSYALTFEQSKNEELLANRLVQNGKNILWDHEFIELLESENGVAVSVRHNNSLMKIRAKYMIACDGASSSIRHQMKFSFRGGTYKNKFFVADTTIDWDQEYNQLIIAPGNGVFCAFLPMYGEKGYRVIGTLPKKYFDKADVSFQEIDDLVKKTLGVKLSFGSVNWFSVYKLHHRVVNSFRQGNIFLAGDSAHIHSPAGGQGMNTGLQDAYNLCWKLALVLKKQASESLLNTYNEERLPFARWLLKFTDRGFNMMTSTNPFIIFFRKFVAINLANKILSIPWVKTMAFRVISQTRYSYKKKSLSKSYTRQQLSFYPGDRLPYFPGESIYDRFTGACFHLLHIHHAPLTDSSQEKIKSGFSFPVKIVEEKPDQKWQQLGVKNELFILVRPDNYIAFVSDDLNETRIREYLKNIV